MKINRKFILTIYLFYKTYNYLTENDYLIFKTIKHVKSAKKIDFFSQNNDTKNRSDSLSAFIMHEMY